MSEKIFHLDNAGKLTELNEAEYISEDLLQQLLADYPSLISGSQIDSLRPRRWLLISREVKVPDSTESQGRWSLDHLFIDQDSIPTLVEVKRSTDTRIRREVIGQILDYAANSVNYWKIEEVIYRYEEQCKETGKDSLFTIEEFLQGENTPEAFWEQTKTNLKAGKIRLLIIADIIPKELQRIIEFLNGQMSPAEILGVEIKQFIGQGNIKTLVPRVIGKTTNADTAKGIGSGKGLNWTEETFFTEFTNKRGQHETEIVRQILNWIIQQEISIWYGEGNKLGSIVSIFTFKGIKHYLFSILTNGTIEISFQWHKFKPPFDEEQKRLEFLTKELSINKLYIC